MLKYYLLAAFMLLIPNLAAPAPLPQVATSGPPNQIIMNTWMVHTMKEVSPGNQKPDNLFQLRVPYDNKRYNVQELHCYNYSLSALDVVSRDHFNCAVMRMYYVLFIGGGQQCLFTTDTGVAYNLSFPDPVWKFVQNNNVDRVRTVCCGNNCQNGAPILSPPAWFLRTDTTNEDYYLNPSKLATDRKVVSARIGSVLEGIASNSDPSLTGEDLVVG